MVGATGCFSKPNFAGTHDGPIDAQLLDGTTDGTVGCSHPLASGTHFATRRNGAVGKLNGDALDDFAVHGIAVEGGLEIPYVWVYFGKASGIDMACPDQALRLPEYRYDPAKFTGGMGALEIRNLLPAQSGHTGDLLIAAATSDGDAQIHWRSYAGATSKDIVSGGRPNATPNWRDVPDASRGFITALPKANGWDIYYGGGGQVYVLNLKDTETFTSDSFHENDTSSFNMPALLTMLPQGFGSTVLSAVTADLNLSQRGLYESDDRRGKLSTVPMSFALPTTGFGLQTEVIHVVRKANLTNEAAVIIKVPQTTPASGPVIELTIPDPLANTTLRTTFSANASLSIRDIFVTNFGSADATLRNQWKVLLLVQKRYDPNGGAPRLSLFDANALTAMMTEASTKSFTVPANDASDYWPPFMVVGNFESTAFQSVRVFHHTANAPLAATGITCFKLDIAPAQHGMMSMPNDLSEVPCKN